MQGNQIFAYAAGLNVECRPVPRYFSGSSLIFWNNVYLYRYYWL